MFVWTRGKFFSNDQCLAVNSELQCRKNSNRKGGARLLPLCFFSNIPALTSITSQFRKQFQAWQDYCREDKWVNLGRINHFALHFSNALACLSNPVSQHIDKRKHLLGIIKGNSQRAETCSTVSQRAQTRDLLAWPGCKTVWKKINEDDMN